MELAAKPGRPPRRASPDTSSALVGLDFLTERRGPCSSCSQGIRVAARPPVVNTGLEPTRVPLLRPACPPLGRGFSSRACSADPMRAPAQPRAGLHGVGRGREREGGDRQTHTHPRSSLAVTTITPGPPGQPRRSRCDWFPSFSLSVPGQTHPCASQVDGSGLCIRITAEGWRKGGDGSSRCRGRQGPALFLHPDTLRQTMAPSGHVQPEATSASWDTALTTSLPIINSPMTPYFPEKGW